MTEPLGRCCSIRNTFGRVRTVNHRGSNEHTIATIDAFDMHLGCERRLIGARSRHRYTFANGPAGQEK
jgi:hypothetical protein